jgi:hypothetical protein
MTQDLYWFRQNALRLARVSRMYCLSRGARVSWGVTSFQVEVVRL